MTACFSLRLTSLYEQDDANLYAEPLVICECVLPYLLQLALKYPQSPVLAQRLDTWVNEHLTHVLEDLTVFRRIVSGKR